MNPHEPLFWLVIITAIIAVSFIMIAGAMIEMAVFVNRAVKPVTRLEEKRDPLINRANAISEQAQGIAVQGRRIAEQFHVMSGHLSTATENLAESTALIKEEVRGIMALADETAEMAHEKVHMVSRAIDTTHERLMDTTEFIQRTVIGPARAPLQGGEGIIFAERRPTGALQIDSRFWSPSIPTVTISFLIANDLWLLKHQPST